MDRLLCDLHDARLPCAWDAFATELSRARLILIREAAETEYQAIARRMREIAAGG